MSTILILDCTDLILKSPHIYYEVKFMVRIMDYNFTFNHFLHYFNIIILENYFVFVFSLSLVRQYLYGVWDTYKYMYYFTYNK